MYQENPYDSTEHTHYQHPASNQPSSSSHTSGMAVAALILGIFSLITCCCGIGGIILSLQSFPAVLTPWKKQQNLVLDSPLPVLYSVWSCLFFCFSLPISWMIFLIIITITATSLLRSFLLMTTVWMTLLKTIPSTISPVRACAFSDAKRPLL